MDPFAFTRALIDVESITGFEKAAGEFLFAALSKLAASTGGVVERMAVGPERFNVLATWGTPVVTLSTHMDTVPSIADTVTETIQWVFPEHAGAPGQIHGGRMMQWITQAGTMAAARVARGTVLLGAMDDIDFLHPVKVGEIAILRARVEYIGTSSLPQNPKTP